MKDISIIIVSWNVREKLAECLTSIEKASQNLNVEVFVVDNFSHDGSADMVEKDFPHVELIRNNYNAGCARAVNRALKRATGDLILWMNPDMRLFDDTLDHVKKVARENPQAGVIGAKLENEKGEIVPHIRNFPTTKDQLAIATKFAKLFPSTLNSYLQKDFDYTKPAYVDSIRGSFFCIPRHIIENIGELDEQFFIWFEEVDYCKRVVNAGYKVLYHPRIRAIDYVGQSFAQVPTAKKQKMFLSSMKKYMKKHVWQK